jgi:hypothetical protein
MMDKTDTPALRLLFSPRDYWEALRRDDGTGRLIAGTVLFIVVSSALYGAVMAGWRSPRLALYVAGKMPLLFIGASSLVMLLNWMVAAVLGSGLTFRQVMALTYGAMGIACWILLSLVPVTALFTFSAVSDAGTHDELRFTHNCLLLTHILLLATAGVAGNAVLFKGLRSLVRARCPAGTLYVIWLAAFAFVGCQMSWILRPFVGSPFYPVVFMRPDCLQRNFYEFLLTEVLPFVFGAR